MTATFVAARQRFANAPLADIDEILAPEGGDQYLRLSQQDTLDWRFELAKKLASQGITPDGLRYNRTMDPLVTDQILAYAVEIQSTHMSVLRFEALKQRYPALWWAQNLHDNRVDRRVLLESLLCSGADHAQIAEHMLAPVDHVWWYEKMFFDASAYLDSVTGYVQKILWPALGTPKTQTEFLLKSLGWKHSLGIQGILAFINITAEPDVTVKRKLTEITERKILNDTLLAVAGRKVNAYNETEVVDHYFRLLAFKADTENVTQDKALVESIQLFLGGISDAVQKLPDDVEVAEEPRAGALVEEVFAKRRQSVQDTHVDEAAEQAAKTAVAESKPM